MNTTIQVSLSGIAFTLEGEAYRLLKEYLVKLESGYRSNPDGEEILKDIEARISELILNHQSNTAVVSPSLIRSILAQLGEPDGITPSWSEATAPSAEPEAAPLPRRLYRNAERARIGGVCAGLGTYFHVEPTMVRLLFCAPLLLCIGVSVIPFVNMLCGFFGSLIGVSLLLYFILWFAIPVARTPRQRLEMMGKPITAAAIRDIVATPLSSSDEETYRAHSVLSELLCLLGRIFIFGVKAFVLLLGIGIMFGVLGILILFGVILFAIPVESGDWIATLLQIGPATILSLALLILLPVGLVIYLLLRHFLHLSQRRTPVFILFGVWVLLLIYLAANLSEIVPEFKGVWHRSISVSPPPSLAPADSILTDTLQVETQSFSDSTLSDSVRIEYFTK